MEVQLNAKTTVEVSAKISQIRIEGKKQRDFIYVRNDKIYGAQVTNQTTFSTKLFVMFVLLGVLGGYAHFMYDTAVLGYNPNPGIIFGIFFVLVVIGYFVSFRKRRVLELVVDSNTVPTIFTFPLGKDISEAKVEDLVDILVN